LAVAVLFGCNPEPEIEEVTVTFDSDGGTAVEAITIEKGKSMDDKYPATPTKGPLDTFAGWFEGTTQYTKDTIINDDITLKWII